MERLRTYIAKRTTKAGQRRWRAAWQDPETGRERARHFERKIDAQQFLEQLRGELQHTGQLVDPARGREGFEPYALRWAAAQAHRPATEELVERHLRLHVLPYFGHRSLASIRPSELQAWVKGRSAELAPATLQVVYRWVSSIFRAAVDDGIIRESPCGRKVKLPKGATSSQVVPLATPKVQALIATAQPLVRPLVVIGAGAGLRQGEVFGLTRDRVDFLRREVRIDRQLAGTDDEGAPLFGPPKTDSSVRTVPLPDVVVDELARHVERHGIGEHELLFRDAAGRPWARNRWADVWSSTLTRAGITAGTGFHELRHYYAALLIRRGASVKTVQHRLGHKSAVTTLDTYGHLWPDSDDETRRAVDEELTGRAATGDRAASG